MGVDSLDLNYFREATLGRLDGYRALVTGGGRGIGRAVAHALAAEGVDVVVAARTRAEVARVAAACRATGRRAAHLTADVTDPDQAARLGREAEDAIGPIDILVHAAGGAESAPLHRTDLALWRRMIAVNLDSVFHCTMALLPGMVARGRGRIIIIASRAGLEGFPYVAAYCAAKHGAVGFVRAAAKETDGRGVTCNAICPGYVDTPMTHASARRIAGKTGITPEEALERLARFNPDGRLIPPEAVAAAVLDLALPAGAQVNGQVITL